MKQIKIITKFYLRELQSTKQHAIYGRVIINRKKSEFATGLKCAPEDWDEALQRCRTKHSQVNDGLLQIEARILDIRLNYQNSNKSLTAATLKQILLNNHKTEYTILEYARYYINKRKGEEGEKVIIRQAEVAVGYLEEFLIKNKCADMLLADFKQANLRDFEVFLQNKKYGVHSKAFKTNTIHKYLTKIKAIFIYAYQQEVINRNPFMGHRIKKEVSERSGLDYYYVKKLMQLDLSNRPELEITRDCFLFCCFTGLRFSYSRKISPKNMYFDEQIDAYVLLRSEEITMASNKKVANRIPLVGSALDIINKYKDHPLTAGLDRLLPTVSNQKTNKKLKELQEMINWHEEPLTFHLSRHTLSSSISNAGTDGSDIIKDKIMGHANNSMSARYSRNISNMTMLKKLREVESLILSA